jgi:translation initiation factor 3 subunit J
VAPVAPALLKVASKWDDEEEDDVLESWDAISDNETAKPATPKVEPKKKKVDSKGAKLVGPNGSPIKESESQRRARLKKAQEEADAANVSDLFGDVKLKRTFERLKIRSFSSFT